MAAVDIVIRGARLRRHPGTLLDIAIDDGRVTNVGQIAGGARTVIDAGGNLVTAAFVNPHLHLDKVYTLEMLDEQALVAYHGDAMRAAASAIDLASRVKARYDRAWILPNVRRAVQQAVRYGTVHVRAFTDVDPKARLEGVHALLQAREEFREHIRIEVVAFPQDGIVRAPGAADLVRQAVRLGADVVGGIPWIERSDADAQRHIDEMLAIAKEFDRGVSMLVDDAGDPALRTLELLARATMRERWEGRVVAHHARAMSLYPASQVHELTALLRDAGIAVVSDPHTGPLHARVTELREAGVVVCLGQDDISDAYYPYGRNNMLEVAFLTSHLLWMTTRAQMELLYDMITTEAARAVGAGVAEPVAGGPADLVVLDVPSVPEALRSHGAPRCLIRGGRVIFHEARSPEFESP